MTNRPYFVMLFTQGGSFTPLMKGEEIAKFCSRRAAEDTAKLNVLGQAFGFQVFHIERGF